MSGRKRFALAGLLAAALAGSAAAQRPMPQSPMPREKTETRVEIELTFDPVNGIELEWSISGAPGATAPAPHEAAVPPCCGFGCCRQPAAWSGAAAAGVAGGLRYSPQPSILGGFAAPCDPQGHDLAFGPLLGSAASPGWKSVGALAGALAGEGRALTSPVCEMNPPYPPSLPVPQATRQGPPDVMKQMAADAFGDLLLQGGVTPSQACPACPPCPLPLVATVPKPAIVGTWFRDVGANRCVIKVAADHMTITVSQAVELNGRTVTSNITFTADYHLARDGHTVAGLITGVDMSFDGDVPEDGADAMLEAVATLRKAVEDRPFAMNCRLYGETLVVGNVRMPELKDQRDQSASYIAGRYASAGEKSLPKQKAMRLSPPPALPAYAPAPYYSGPGLNSLTPDAVAVPAGSLLPPPTSPYSSSPSGATLPALPPEPMTVPALPEVPPMMAPPTPPAPTMTPPVPPLGPTSLNKSPNDHRQLFSFTIGLFGSQ